MRLTLTIAEATVLLTAIATEESALHISANSFTKLNDFKALSTVGLRAIYLGSARKKLAAALDHETRDQPETKEN